LGSKNKLKRFKENETFKNVIQPSREEVVTSFIHKGEWHSFFGNNNPIGIDIKGARFWRGAKTAIEENLENVAFVRTQIELVDFIFAKNEVSEIWITFPDPQIKYKRTKHRMTNAVFMKKYHQILKKDGLMNLKTDSEFMHGYTLGLLHGEGHEILNANHNVYKNEGSPKEVTETQTFYENQYLKVGKPITYIQFRLKY
jgi:tRNA (guanine-N7-)-methyltransferase